jgi:hypothetical protein
LAGPCQSGGNSGGNRSGLDNLSLADPPIAAALHSALIEAHNGIVAKQARLSMSALPPIVLQNSFWGWVRNFPEALVRSS